MYTVSLKSLILNLPQNFGRQPPQTKPLITAMRKYTPTIQERQLTATSTLTAILRHRTNTHLSSKKDSREALSVMIQLHCVALEEDIVIGAALCQNNPLITSTNSAKAAAAYYLPHRINMLNSTIDLTGAIPATYTVFAFIDRMSVSMSVAAAQAKSWVLIDPTTNKLILGRNRDFAIGQYDKLWLCSVNAAKIKQLQEEIE